MGVNAPLESSVEEITITLINCVGKLQMELDVYEEMDGRTQSSAG